MTPEREQRHKQPGRRASDRRDFAAGVLVEAATDGDRLFPTWRKEDVIKWLTIVSMVGGIGVAVLTFISARFATRAQIESAVKPVVDTLNAIRKDQDTRIGRLEARQDTDDAIRSLIPAIARTTCIRLEIDRSSSIAEAAALPCDSLLNRRTR